jgi:hypothetical protein
LHGDSFRVSVACPSDTQGWLSWLYQAFKNHKLVDVFHQPGECDLTANVDFAFLKEAVSDLREHPFFPSRIFFPLTTRYQS